MNLQDPWDSTDEARKPDRPLLEKDIQSKCVDWARARGWWARKFSSPANRSVPDYLFAKPFSLGTENYKLAVEFKKTGEISTQAQWDEQYLMWEHGWDVRECDSIPKFKRMIEEIEARFLC